MYRSNDSRSAAGAPFKRTRSWPERDKAKRLDLIAIGKCPECGDCLDTGWECTDCGYDAMPERRKP